MSEKITAVVLTVEEVVEGGRRKTEVLTIWKKVVIGSKLLLFLLLLHSCNRGKG